MRCARGAILGAAVALAVLVGCGGSGTNDARTATTAKTSAAKSKGLATALRPRCGVGRFGRRRINPVVKDGKKSWQLSFVLAPTAPKIEGQTTTMTVLESEPGPVETVVGAHFVTVAGRRVSLRKKSPQIPNHIAEWRTDKAHYVALADGDTTEALYDLIRCLP
jgi:hypothetical protein